MIEINIEASNNHKVIKAMRFNKTTKFRKVLQEIKMRISITIIGR